MSKTVVIASLYPAPFHAQRPSFPQREYRIQRCTDLNKPQICVVADQDEKPYIGLGRTGLQTWPAAQIAADIANEWGSGAFGRAEHKGAIPAIWVSEGAKLINGEWVIPQAEIAFHRAQQEEVLRSLVQIGRMMFERMKQTPLQVCFNAADMLNVRDERWQERRTSQSTMACPYCKEINASDAAKCKNCQEILDKQRYDELQQQILRIEMSSEPGAGKLSADDVPVEPPVVAAAKPSKTPLPPPLPGGNKPATVTA